MAGSLHHNVAQAEVDSSVGTKFSTIVSAIHLEHQIFDRLAEVDGDICPTGRHVQSSSDRIIGHGVGDFPHSFFCCSDECSISIYTIYNKVEMITRAERTGESVAIEIAVVRPRMDGYGYFAYGVCLTVIS